MFNTTDLLLNLYRTKEKKLMQTFNKTTTIFLATLLVVSMAASTILLPTTSAHTPPWQIPTYAFINVAPNPVGVGQNVLVIMWIDKIFSPETGLGNNYRFHNYKLTITDPDGANTTQSFSTVTDPTAAQTYRFTPDKVGTYTFSFAFPGQNFTQYDYPNTPNENGPNGLINDTFLASSASTTLTVTQQPIPPSIGSYPLPTEYWARPIYGENPGWWTISSNWLGMGAPVLASVGSGDIGAYGIFNAVLNRYPGDAVGPQTNHIMWTKPLQSGGVVGGNTFAIQGDTYFEGSAYDQRYTNPIILDGKIYYQAPLNFNSEGTMAGAAISGTFCVDLRTGQQIWMSTSIPAGQISFGYIYDTQQPNQKGVFPPILFTSGFAEAYDADTGILLFNVTNVPGSGSLFGPGVPETMGPNGEHLRYIVTGRNLLEWNSSNLWSWNIIVGGGTPLPDTSNFNVTAFNPFVPPSGAFVTTSYYNTVNGDGSNRYDWNVSLPSSVPSSFTQIAAFYGNLMLCLNGSLPTLDTGGLPGVVSNFAPYTYFALNLNSSRGALGSLLWMKTVNPVAGNLTVLQGPVDPVAGVFVEGYKETMQWVGYSLATGDKLWGPTQSQPALDYYGNPITPLIQAQLAYGNLYTSGYAGILYCFDLTTGNLKWSYGNGGVGNTTFAGFDNPFGHYPTFINAVGDGVIYTVSSEHTVNTPIYKGALARAINATDGTEIWTLSSYTGEFGSMSYAIADGYATWFNGYDNQIYSVGRGPSTITVQAPQTSISAGENVVIQGTVTDISAGTQQNEQATRFPNGVPVASDASMREWMGYVYQQKPLPTNFTGVTVSIDAFDPNGNLIHIGDATTNSMGAFHFTWTPPNVPGDYNVAATFAGTNGYWPSTAGTAMNVVGEHPTASPAPTAAPSASDLYFVPAVAGLFVLIIVVAIVLALLMLRKRP